MKKKKSHKKSFKYLFLFATATYLNFEVLNRKKSRK